MCDPHDKTAQQATTGNDEPDNDLLICKKTGRAMPWDRAHCPNKGKTCAYRAECQIQNVIEELKDESDQTQAHRQDP